MSEVVLHMACNLLLNAATSFVAGLLLVLLVIRIFRVQTTRAKLFLLLLPFTKIVWDLSHGIPSGSYLFSLSPLDPWALPPRHRTLMLGAGLSYFGPVLSLAFAVVDESGAE